jgi:signal transduction histidine kinase
MAVHVWTVAAFANGLVAMAYLGITWIVVRGLAAAGRWRANPLAVATALIFFSCGVGHGIHFVHLVLDEHGTRAATDLHLALWDLSTGIIATWYFTLRSRFPALVRGAALYEDMRERQRQALEIHDNVVQGVATAKLALEVGDRDTALAALGTTLGRAKAIISDLLGEQVGEAPLRRDEAASAS